MNRHLNQRQENILLSLKKLDFLSRDQLQRIHRLGKVRNANRILQDLSPYLSSYREEYSTIYYLNANGRAYVNSDKIRKKTNFVQHVLMRNEFYIHAGFPFDWKNEIQLSDGEITVICDALFKWKDKYHVLEVDRAQNMKDNRKKIENYKGLFKNGVTTEHFGYFPKLVWVTTSELRKRRLIELCKGLPYAVYIINEIK
jgi:hypothetical protein